MSVLETGRRVLRAEADAVRALADQLGPEFDRAVQILGACTGKIVLSGMGKSGIVCRKIASTLTSTGTPAFFMHPAEGVHGDLGILARGDAMVAVSNSGETEELLAILPILRSLSIQLVAMTGRPGSTLARRSDVVLGIPVREEACPLNLAPMASTTAALALGDALAAALMECKGFSAADFARVHPAGSLGRRLVLQVQDLMHEGASVPRVLATTSMRAAVLEMTSKRLGFTGVFDPKGALVGIVTDGDLRRMLGRTGDVLELPVEEVMTRNPKSVRVGTMAADALQLMEDHGITNLFVLEPAPSEQVAGVIHIHDLVKAGLR